MIGEEQMNAPLRADFQGSGTSRELRTASMASSFIAILASDPNAALPEV
jgi:hypothetical protein